MIQPLSKAYEALTLSFDSTDLVKTTKSHRGLVYLGKRGRRGWWYTD